MLILYKILILKDEKGFITKDDFRSFLIKNKFYPT